MHRTRPEVGNPDPREQVTLSTQGQGGASLALIELKQRGSGMANVGVDFGETDFAAVADGLGGRGVWVEDREALMQELDAALQAETFTILGCRIGRAAHDGRL